MISAKFIANWMQSELLAHGCLYQDDVVDYAVKRSSENLVRENSEGNLVLGHDILYEFKSLNNENVVWVRSGRYWRLRVPEDGKGRETQG